MKTEKLTPSQLQEGLKALPDWKLVNGKLHAEITFNSFAEAIGFVTSAAIYADKIDHHPEWFNVYNRVVIDLVTHSLGGISNKDLQLAKEMSRLFAPSSLVNLVT